MRIVVLFSLKPGTEIGAFEEWVRTRDLPGIRALVSVSEFQLYRTTGLLGGNGAPAHQYVGLIDVDGTPVSYERQGHALVFANLLGLPVLAVPAGRDAQGLPVGVQLVGPHWSELRLLEIAHELEESGLLPGPPRLTS
jgi:hypothetical protein